MDEWGWKEIEPWLNPHNLRHRHAAELREEDADLYTVMHQLGHQSLDTTAKYLRSIAPMEVLEPIGKRGAPMMPLPKIRDM